jgi:Predicted membrane protein
VPWLWSARSWGCLASTVNPFATGVASATLKISPGEGLIPRLILLVIVTALGIWYTMHYADQVKKIQPSH